MFVFLTGCLWRFPLKPSQLLGLQWALCFSPETSRGGGGGWGCQGNKVRVLNLEAATGIIIIFSHLMGSVWAPFNIPLPRPNFTYTWGEDVSHHLWDVRLVLGAVSLQKGDDDGKASSADFRVIAALSFVQVEQANHQHQCLHRARQKICEPCIATYVSMCMY